MGAGAEEGAGRKSFFDIAPDGRNLTDRRAVRQHERRYDAARIDGAIGVRMLFPLSEVDRHQVYDDCLFGKEDAYPPRIG